jgi:hypothetical protein
MLGKCVPLEYVISEMLFQNTDLLLQPGILFHNTGILFQKTDMLLQPGILFHNTGILFQNTDMLLQNTGMLLQNFSCQNVSFQKKSFRK